MEINTSLPDDTTYLRDERFSTWSHFSEIVTEINRLRDRHAKAPPFLTQFILAFIISLGVIGNLLIIQIISTSKTLNTPANYFIINLALADLLFLVSGISTLINVINDGAMIYGETGCLIFTLSLTLTSCVSLVAIVLIAVSRYVAVVKPTWKGFLSKRLCRGLCILSWCYCAAITAKDYAQMGSVYVKTIWTCTHDFNSSRAGTVISIFLTQGLGSAIMIACYLPMLYVFYKSTSKIFSEITAQNNALKARRRQQKRLAGQLLIIFCVYNLCWIPFGVVPSIDPEGTLPVSVYSLIIVLPCVNSSINMLLYMYFNSTFRQILFKKLIRKSNGVGKLGSGSGSGAPVIVVSSSV